MNVYFIYRDFSTYIYLSLLFYSFTFSLTPSFSLFSHFSFFIVIIFSPCRLYRYVFFVVFPSWHSAQAQISGLLFSSVLIGQYQFCFPLLTKSISIILFGILCLYLCACKCVYMPCYFCDYLPGLIFAIYLNSSFISCHVLSPVWSVFFNSL